MRLLLKSIALFLFCFHLFQFPKGFIAHFYSVSESISPVLAWGFFGPDGALKDMCNFFKVRLSLHSCWYCLHYFEFYLSDTHNHHQIFVYSVYKMTRPHHAYKVTISNGLLIYINVEHSRNIVSFIFGWELKIMHSNSSITCMFRVFMLRKEIH